MKRAKIKLHLESLDVESFTPSVHEPRAGTVMGNGAPTIPTNCWSQCFAETACCFPATHDCTSMC